MRHAELFLDRKTGTLHVQPGWPPLPSEGDHWEKTPVNTRGKRLERRVVEIRGWRLKYEDQGGTIRSCSTDAFRKWTDDVAARPKKLREYVVKTIDCRACEEGERCFNCRGTGKCVALREKKRPKPHHKEAYVWRSHSA